MSWRAGEKAILREATRRRIRAERAVMQHHPKISRMEMQAAVKMLQDVPSVYAFAEAYAKEIGASYHRPEWASQIWGSR